MEEKRKDRRMSLSAKLLIKNMNDDSVKAEEVEIEVLDVSKTGVGFICNSPLSIGAVYEAHLKLWTDEVIHAFLKVVRIEQTKDEKYKKALDLLYSQFAGQPRNEDGGFWHKKIYPHQMWLDGLYMGAPFYAEYAFRNNRPQDYADVINQFITCARHTYDPKNGLYRHACDVSRTERWADPVTGQSKHCWGRALGWYAMALVDVLDFIPKHEAGRDSLLAILDNVAVQVKKLQDPETGGWYQVMDRSGDKGNYLESSCSAMFIYSLFKAVRMGYIDPSYLDVAKAGYEGFLKNFIEVDKDGVVTITKACAVAGLGGKVYRSGDYDYYINETIRNNDPKAVGPFIMASLEYERLQK